MSSFYCSNCDGPVAINADECKKCGGKFDSFAVEKIYADVRNARRKQRTKILGKNGWVVWVVGVPALCYLLILVNS